MISAAAQSFTSGFQIGAALFLMIGIVLVIVANVRSDVGSTWEVT